MCTLARSEDPDKIAHIVAFHQGLDSFLRQKQSSEKEMQFFIWKLKIIYDPSIDIMDHPKLSYETRRKNPIMHKGIIF